MRNIILLLAILIASFNCPAQESRGAILGRITDSTEAVIPDASLRVTNNVTGATQSATSNQQGNYLFPYLMPGRYEVVAEKAGFKRAAREDVELRASDRLELNISLEIGETRETITVIGETPLLESDTGSLGQVVDGRRLAELPLPHGNTFQLAWLAPGAAFAMPGWYFAPQPYYYTGANFAISGVKMGRTDVAIDGIPATHKYGNNFLIAAETPMSDLIGEVKIQTSLFDASVGQTEGGLLNYSMKSGTNDLHGTAFYFKMAPEMTGNLFFANKARQPRPDFTYNRWGGTIGGPVTLPHIYHGRNRTFFIYGYEGIRDVTPRGTIAAVPTSDQRRGDFSSLLALGSIYQIYNPLTRRQIAGGRIQSDPFSGNIIPPELISPIAKKVISYYPQPLAPGLADGTNNYPHPNTPGANAYYSHSIRLDHVTAGYRIYGRFNASRGINSQLNNLDNWLLSGDNLYMANRSYTVDQVYSFSPTFTANVRVGYVRFNRYRPADAYTTGFDLTSLGFPSSYNTLIESSSRRFPGFSVAGYIGMGGRTQDWIPREVFTTQGGFEKITGNHSLKFGMEYRGYPMQSFNTTAATPRFVFDSTWTAGPFDNSAGAPMGQGLASLLLGLPSSGSVARVASYAERSTAWSFYVHDSWKLTRRLTVSLGLRYELEGPLTERFNRSVRGFDPNATLPIEAQVLANYARSPTPEVPPDQFRVRGGLTFAGVNGQPRTLWNYDTDNFMPRLGLAYAVTRKTMIRAGFGITYGALGVRRVDVNQEGFSQTTDFIPSLDNGLTFISTLADPFPNGIQKPFGAALGAMTDVGKSVSFFNPNPEAPRQLKWQIGVQRELPKRIILEATYVSNRGSDLEVTQNPNSVPNNYLSTSSVRDQSKIDYLSGNLSNPFYPLLPGTNRSGVTTARANLLTLYPQFSGVSTTTSNGNSWYKSLQMKVERRFAQGFTLQAAYTWSNLVEATTLLNGGDAAAWKGVSDQNYPHIFAASGIYELPFGPKRRWLGGAKSVGGVLLGGWQIQGFFTLQSMQPLNWGNVIFTGNVNNIPLSSSQRTPEHWFNTDGFERASAKQLSYNVRTFPLRLSNVHSHTLNNWDLSIIKGIKITEKVSFQLRGELINAFNHVTFAAPNMSPTSTAFGAVTSEISVPRKVQAGLKFLF